MIFGTSFDIEHPVATISGSPPGVSVSFSPPVIGGTPPSGLITMSINVAPSAAAGTYTITVDDGLFIAGSDCSGVCVQPTYQLTIVSDSDVVDSVSLAPSSGSTVQGIAAAFPVDVTAMISGSAYDTASFAYSISPPAQGISVSFSPFSVSGSPPSGDFSMTVTASASAPPGVYVIRVGEMLAGGTFSSDVSCYPIIGSTCAGVFTLDVLAAGAAIPVNLQDNLNVGDENVHSPAATLSDILGIYDAYVPPVVATLSDVLGIHDAYVAPVVATLSDVVGVIDHYMAPVDAFLSDTVSFGEHLTSTPTAAAITGFAGSLLVSVFLVVRMRKSKKNR